MIARIAKQHYFCCESSRWLILITPELQIIGKLIESHVPKLFIVTIDFMSRNRLATKMLPIAPIKMSNIPTTKEDQPKFGLFITSSISMVSTFVSIGIFLF